MDRSEPDAVFGVVRAGGVGYCGVAFMNEYEYGWLDHEAEVDTRVRSLFWRGYVLGLLTVVMVVGCMYV